MAGNNLEDINFQLYVDGLKQKKISWNFFLHFIQDLSYSDIDRLRILNAILLAELTMNYSDIEKMKYLNGILLIQFKNYIFALLAENDQVVEDLQESYEDQISNEETFEETTEEILTDEDIQMPILNEIKDDLTSSCKEEIVECNPSETNPKIFLCYICNKEYHLYFHLKQHISNIHEKNNIHNDQKIDENKISDNKTDNSIEKANNSKNHVHTIQEGVKHHKSKLFTLKKNFEALNKLPATEQSKSTNKPSENDMIKLPRFKPRPQQKKDNVKCDICDKMFVYKTNLNQHKTTHLPRTKTYACNWCNVTFINDFRLKVHNRKHPTKQQCKTCSFRCHKNLLPHAYCKKCDNGNCTFVTQAHSTYLKHQLECKGIITCPKLECKTTFKSPYVYVVRRHMMEFHQEYLL